MMEVREATFEMTKETNAIHQAMQEESVKQSIN